MPNNPKQRAITNPNKELGGMGILYNAISTFENPYSLDAAYWRYIAKKQPIVMICIGNHIMRIQALPWDIRAKDANRSDELQSTIEEHRKIFREFGGKGFLNGVDQLLQDYFMAPFGGAIEPVKYSDKRLFKIVNVDAATLYPTNNPNLPIVQKVGAHPPVYFKPDELYRIYQFPRPEIDRQGWGMSPVERVYLAVELMARGDRYYAQLLLDTPEAGLLDLGDMSKDSAEKWLDSFRNMMTGIDAFKIPVLYQHTSPASWIPFGRPPTDMLFDQITFKYAQIVCASFGLTAGDVGIKGSGGSGLSGQIRDERSSRATGYASVKAKLVELFNNILPEDLEFAFIDTDDELLVAKGRARSANAVAGRNLIESGALTPIEWRKQLIADGLVTIPLTEKPNETEFDIIKEIDGTADQLELQKEQLEVSKIAAKNKPTTGVPGKNGGKGLNKQRQLRGGKLESVQGKEPKPASAGGQGEIKSEVTDESALHILLSDNSREIVNRANGPRVRKLIKCALREVYPTIQLATQKGDYAAWKSEYIKALFDVENSFPSETIDVIKSQITNFSDVLSNDKWWETQLDETDIGDTFAVSYANGLEDAATNIQTALYEEGISNKSDVTLKVTLGDDTFEELYGYAREFSDRLDKHNEFFIKRLSIAAIAEATVDNETIFVNDLEYILDEDEFINRAASIFLVNFDELMNRNYKQFSTVQHEMIYEKAVERQYKEVGFSVAKITRSELKNIKPNYFAG